MQQGSGSAIFSLEKRWFLVCGGALLQASVWRHQIHILDDLKVARLAKSMI